MYDKKSMSEPNTIMNNKFYVKFDKLAIKPKLFFI